MKGNQNITEKGVQFIANFEGYLATAYWDKTGKVWTIGYGHTKGVKEGDSCTKAQALKYLADDCATAVAAVNKYMAQKTEWATGEPRNNRYSFTQYEFDALVSFTFNCGAGNLKALTASGTRTKKQIASKITAYTKSGGVELAGLVRRRKAEYTLFATGKYTDGY